jgi:hypothetical protein
VDGWIILKYMRGDKMGWCASKSCDSKYGLEEGSCERCNERLGSIKYLEIF